MNILDSMSPENQEAIMRNEHDLSISESEMTDDEFNNIVDGRIGTSKSFWNHTFNLEKIQEQNEKLWLNDTISQKDLFNFQVPYKDNRIFTSIETIIPQALAYPHFPIVTEAIDSDASRELARNLQHTLLSLYDSLDLRYSLTMVIRHLLGGMRFAALKYRYDNSLGYIGEDGSRKGAFVVEHIRPQSIVFDAGATRKRLPFMAEYVQSSGDELIEKFPDKKDEIYRQLKQDDKKSHEIITYPEMNFEYFKNGERQYGVGWKYENINLGRIKNPYWNYEEPEANFFDHPRFPYVIFNYLSMGRYIVDDTSLTEQAYELQRVVNKRGRQIVENADSANGGRIFNSEMISPDDASQVVGDPNETIMVKGDVQKAFARIAPPPLADYVIADKIDARNEIDNIFGTHAPLKGAGSNSKTLGQEVISQNQDKSRITTIGESLDRGMKELYQGLTQMICVFWDTPTQVVYTGTDGKSIHMEFDRSKVERGIGIGVKAGSALKKDQVEEANKAIKMAALYDPLTLAEKMGEDDPKEVAKRIVYFKFAMNRYTSEVLGESADGNMDSKAMADVKAIIANQYPLPPVPKTPSKEYIATLQTFIQSGAFEQMPPEVKQRIAEFSKQVLETAKQALQLQQEQASAAQMPPGGQPTVQPQSPQLPPTGESAAGFAA